MVGYNEYKWIPNETFLGVLSWRRIFRSSLGRVVGRLQRTKRRGQWAGWCWCQLHHTNVGPGASLLSLSVHLHKFLCYWDGFCCFSRQVGGTSRLVPSGERFCFDFSEFVIIFLLEVLSRPLTYLANWQRKNIVKKSSAILFTSLRRGACDGFWQEKSAVWIPWVGFVFLTSQHALSQQLSHDEWSKFWNSAQFLQWPVIAHFPEQPDQELSRVVLNPALFKNALS